MSFLVEGHFEMYESDAFVTWLQITSIDILGEMDTHI